MSFTSRKDNWIVYLLVASLLFWGGYVYFLDTTEAAALTNVRDTLSTSAPNVSSTHTILFITPTGAQTSTQTITVEIDVTTASFTIPENFNEDDVDLERDNDNGCNGPWTPLETTSSAAAADTWGIAVNTSTDIVTFTHPTNNGASSSIQANRCVRMTFGAAATQFGTGDADIANPPKVAAGGTADVYTIAIAGSFPDSGNAMVAIIEGVAITATVAETLSFSIAGVAGASCTEGGSASTTVTTVVTSTPFGTIGTGFTKGCQDLIVGTNAANGYTMTGQENRELTFASSVIPNTTCDGGTCTNTATSTWVDASNDGFGYACNPAGATDDCVSAFGTSTDYRSFSTSTAISILSRTSPTPASNSTSRIIYKVSISANQAAGSYSNTVTWIATPQF